MDAGAFLEIYKRDRLPLFFQGEPDRDAKIQKRLENPPLPPRYWLHQIGITITEGQGGGQLSLLLHPDEYYGTPIPGADVHIFQECFKSLVDGGLLNDALSFDSKNNFQGTFPIHGKGTEHHSTGVILKQLLDALQVKNPYEFAKGVTVSETTEYFIDGKWKPRNQQIHSEWKELFQ